MKPYEQGLVISYILKQHQQSRHLLVCLPCINDFRVQKLHWRLHFLVSLVHQGLRVDHKPFNCPIAQSEFAAMLPELEFQQHQVLHGCQKKP